MAQNEMRAMRGMPLRVPSMEGLGRSLAVPTLEDNERDTVVFVASSACESGPSVQGLARSCGCRRGSAERLRVCFTSELCIQNIHCLVHCVCQ